MLDLAQKKDKILLRKIALCIKNIRNNKNITLDDFYVDTGIHLARIEQGKTNISITTFSIICKYFEVSYVEFFKLLDEI